MIWGGKNLGFGTGVQAEPARSGSGASVGVRRSAKFASLRQGPLRACAAVVVTVSPVRLALVSDQHWPHQQSDTACCARSPLQFAPNGPQTRELQRFSCWIATCNLADSNVGI